jgi:hypothetical protein
MEWLRPNLKLHAQSRRTYSSHRRSISPADHELVLLLISIASGGLASGSHNAFQGRPRGRLWYNTAPLVAHAISCECVIAPCGMCE